MTYILVAIVINVALAIVMVHTFILPVDKKPKSDIESLNQCVVCRGTPSILMYDEDVVPIRTFINEAYVSKFNSDWNICNHHFKERCRILESEKRILGVGGTNWKIRTDYEGRKYGLYEKPKDQDVKPLDVRPAEYDYTVYDGTGHTINEVKAASSLRPEPEIQPGWVKK